MKARIHRRHIDMYLIVERKRELAAGPAKLNKRPTSLLRRQIQCAEEIKPLCKAESKHSREVIKSQNTNKSWPCSSHDNVCCWWDTLWVSGQRLAKHLQSSSKRMVRGTGIAMQITTICDISLMQWFYCGGILNGWSVLKTSLWRGRKPFGTLHWEESQ